MKGNLSREVLGNIPAAIALGGPDDGKIFLLKNDIVNIGRNDRRTSRPFVRIRCGPGRRLYCGPPGYPAAREICPGEGDLAYRGLWQHRWHPLNNRKLEKMLKPPVQDGDLIELAKGNIGSKTPCYPPRFPSDHHVPVPEYEYAFPESRAIPGTPGTESSCTSGSRCGGFPASSCS